MPKFTLKNIVLASTTAVATVALPASAAIDVSGVVTTITTDGGAAVAAIGGAMLALAAIAITFKWAKAAIFG